jgi:CRP-like cAMP-binding protein
MENTARTSREFLVPASTPRRIPAITPRAPKREPIPNSVLAALPRPAYEALRSGFEEVQLIFGDILYEPGDVIRNVYFPSDSLVSLLTLVDSHSALEVGMVGREGMVGMSLTLGSSISPVRALVQGAGKALRMNAARFRKEFKRSAPLQRGLFTYLNALMAQITQTAACNRFHRIEGRLARWLLMTSDRVCSDKFELTQDFLSHMLGVRRVGVTEAASALQKQKLIEYRRGHITILNHAGLEAASCPCYALVRDMNEGKRKA